MSDIEAPKLTKQDVETLYCERQEILEWLNPPPPDPNVWPPVGWQIDPRNPGFVFRILEEGDLREELFGSERKTQWTEQAKAALASINAKLLSYFFPKPKPEGIERKEKSGFVATQEGKIDRKLDVAALAAVVENCQTIAAEKKLQIDVEAAVIDWKPTLKLKEYRDLPKAIQHAFDQALIATPKPPTFEIVRISKDDA